MGSLLSLLFRKQKQEYINTYDASLNDSRKHVGSNLPHFTWRGLSAEWSGRAWDQILKSRLGAFVATVKQNERKPMGSLLSLLFRKQKQEYINTYDASLNDSRKHVGSNLPHFTWRGLSAEWSGRAWDQILKSRLGAFLATVKQNERKPMGPLSCLLGMLCLLCLLFRKQKQEYINTYDAFLNGSRKHVGSNLPHFTRRGLGAEWSGRAWDQILK